MVKRASNFVRDLVRMPQAFQLMVIIAILVVAGCMAGCATQPTNGGMTVNVPADKVARCKAEGGCGFISMQELLKMLNEAFELGRGSGT